MKWVITNLDSVTTLIRNGLSISSSRQKIEGYQLLELRQSLMK